MTRGPVRSLLGAALVLVALTTLGGCGGSTVDPALQSSPTKAFEVVTHDDQRYVVGHGIEMTMPRSWVTYGSERVGTDGSTWEWAAGLPVDTKPLPAGAQYSMGKPGQGVQIDSLPVGAKKLAETSPGYKFLDDGKADVPGATEARYLRFERDLQLSSGTVHVEQVSLFIEVKKGVTSTIRFIAAAGQWDKQMKTSYESVTVAEGEST